MDVKQYFILICCHITKLTPRIIKTYDCFLAIILSYIEINFFYLVYTAIIIISAGLQPFFSIFDNG